MWSECLSDGGRGVATCQFTGMAGSLSNVCKQWSPCVSNYGSKVGARSVVILHSPLTQLVRRWSDEVLRR